MTIYDLPTLHEQFDLVFVGTVMDHVCDLAGAFEAVRQVTRSQAVIACAGLLDYAPLAGWQWLTFQTIRVLQALGRLHDQVVIARKRPVALYTANEGGSIWRPSILCIQELLLSAGFRDVAIHGRVALKNFRHGTTMDHVVFHAFI